MTTRRNHYLPVWYQKGLVSVDSPRLFYLHLDPQPGERDRGEPPAIRKCATQAMRLVPRPLYDIVLLCAQR